MVIFRLSERDVFHELQTTPSGLSFEEARQRLRRYGPNTIRRAAGPSLARKILRQFTHFLALLLWVAGALAFLAEWLHPGEGMATLGWAILSVIVVNASFTFLQERKAEQAVQALQRLLPETVWVLRDGQPRQISREDLVPGDLLPLEEGEQVPADARLIEAVQLRVDLASLTGEASAKARQVEPVLDPALTDPLHASNLVFAGTTILSGHGLAVVYATGMHTEFGGIAQMATGVEPDLSPLQREIARVTRIVAIFAAAMGALFFTIGMATGLGFWVSFVFGVGIIVANVPEGLLPTVTLALAMGSQRMARRKALIKHLTSVETLGCATVICTDKTGTLTENRMRVDRLYLGGDVIIVPNGCPAQHGHPTDHAARSGWALSMQVMALCNNARPVQEPDGRPGVVGDPTEVALFEFARQYVSTEAMRHPRMGELPFDADRKRMTTIHSVGGQPTAYVKGAPESVVPLCRRRLDRDDIPTMWEQDRDAILAQSRTFAQDAYRVLALAMRDLPGPTDTLNVDTVERDLTFLGLVALMDPPHREVPDAIRRCRQAGIRVIMITGDHVSTAQAVARKIGMILVDAAGSEDASTPIEGAQVESMTDLDLRSLLIPGRGTRTSLIFARMAPRHKMRVVVALKDLGEVVAVTGDGVNDAPALKKADIGIAMGVAGTDVAKETADMILLDDNFASIVNAIEEGRTVYANIKKFVTYILASNVPEIVPYLGYGIFSWPLALTVPQILAVDLGTDMLPALALGSEPPHPGIMEIPPRPRTERLLSRRLLLRAYGFLGLIEAGIAMIAFFWFLFAQGWTWGAALAWTDPLFKQATTVTFAAIVISQMANLFACRSERSSAFRLGFLTNPFMLLGLAVEIALLLLIVYSPTGNLIFGTAPLPLWVCGLLILGAIGLLLAEEARKVIAARFMKTA